MDTVETGNLFSTLMEWTEKGLIDDKFTDGVHMSWGNGDGMIALAEKIGKIEGCGKKLSEGPYWLAKEMGEEAMKYVYDQKGMCATGVETRSTIGSMLQFALLVVPTICPAYPRQNGLIFRQSRYTLRDSLKPGASGYITLEGIARLVQFYENLFELPDSLGIRKFNFGHLGFWHDRPEDIEKMWDYLTKALLYATGTSFTKGTIHAGNR